jgi:hypothetical protein
MQKIQTTLIQLLCSILLCLLLPAAHAQYGLGLTRQQVKKMIKKQYKGQGVKVGITEERNGIRITATDGAGQVCNYYYYFGGSDTCLVYQAAFAADSARQQAIQQLVNKGWQKLNRYMYLSSYEKQQLLMAHNDTPLYNYKVHPANLTKERYDTMIARAKRWAESFNKMPDKSMPVIWQPGIKLKWEYYMRSVGKPSPEAGDAHTYCNLYCNIDDVQGDSTESVAVNIYAVMLPNNSWVAVDWSSVDKDLRQEINNDSLLAYEQLHFDLAELVARQLRRDLSQVILPRGKYRQKIKKMLDEAAVTLSKLQQQYDDAVKHNPASPQMAVWQQDIARQLTELNPYTKHTVEVDIR